MRFTVHSPSSPSFFLLLPLFFLLLPLLLLLYLLFLLLLIRPAVSHDLVSEDQMRSAFEIADTNGDGVLTYHEAVEVSCGDTREEKSSDEKREKRLEDKAQYH